MKASREIARGAGARVQLGDVRGAARAYLACCGTSGSLLAGAALMFIVASALVGFSGWPHVGAPPSPGQVFVAPRATAATGSTSARRLALISAAPTARAPRTPATATPGGAGAGGGALHMPAPRTLHSIGTPAANPAPASAAPTNGGGSPPSPPSAPAPATALAPIRVAVPAPVPTRPVRQVVHQATGALGQVVSGTGGTVGSGVQQTTSAAAGAVQPVSPSVAGIVNSAGSGAAKTVTGVTQTIAGALSGVGGH